LFAGSIGFSSESAASTSSVSSWFFFYNFYRLYVENMDGTKAHDNLIDVHIIVNQVQEEM